jgi:hypothetical protein
MYLNTVDTLYSKKKLVRLSYDQNEFALKTMFIANILVSLSHRFGKVKSNF